MCRPVQILRAPARPRWFSLIVAAIRAHPRQRPILHPIPRRHRHRIPLLRRLPPRRLPPRPPCASGSSGSSTNPPAPLAPPAPSTHAAGRHGVHGTLGTLNQLDIIGTSSNDSILVSQSGSTITIVSNGNTQQVTGAFGEILVNGGDGDDTITVDSSVNINTLLYGGAGNNTISSLGSGQNAIVTVGNGGVDTVQGNGVSTNYWVDTNDVVNATSGEIAAGMVHRIVAFYQPFTNDPTNPNYIPLSVSGQNLPDPTDSGTTINLSSSSLWGGAGPTQADVNQGDLGDCYFLAPLEALANQSPATLRTLAVDMGDGTYVVQFNRGGGPTYVRVDADLPSSWGSLSYAHPGSSGSIWAPIMEKAYAFFRTASNTFASLNSGWMGSVFTDLGINNQTVYLGVSAALAYSTVSADAQCGRRFHHRHQRQHRRRRRSSAPMRIA